MGLLDRIRNLGAPETAEDADRLAIRQLEGRGADLARARHIVHVLSAADEAAARAAAAGARELGYDTDVAAPTEEGGEWMIRASAHRVVHPSTIAAFRAAFESLAEDAGARYDGWEAASTP